jgi:hypothetical protein
MMRAVFMLVDSATFAGLSDKREPIRIGYLADKVRPKANPVVGKAAVSRHLLLQRSLNRTQRDGKEGRNVAAQAKLVCRGDHLAYTNAFGKLDRRDVARIGKGVHQRDRPFEGIVVIVRRVGANAGRKRNRRVDNYLLRACPFIHRSV